MKLYNVRNASNSLDPPKNEVCSKDRAGNRSDAQIKALESLSCTWAAHYCT